MQFEPSVRPYLDGESFSNGLKVRISEPESGIPTRIEHLLAMARGKKIIHVGCVDHVPLIRDKIRRGVWLHKLLLEVAPRVHGIDIDEEGVRFVKEELGIPDVVRLDVIADPVSDEVRSEKWDLMILGELVEHIDNPVQFLAAIREKYAPYVAEMVITVPNAFRIENYRMARRHQEWINTDHRYWFTPYTLSKVVGRAGLTVTGFQFCQGYRIPARNFPKRMLLKRYPAYRDTLVLTARL